MKKISIYICNDNKKMVITPLLDLKSSYKDTLEIIGSGPQNENSLKEIVLSRVDVAITGLLSTRDCKTLCEMSPSTKILMLTNDSNRAKAVVGDLNKERNYNVNFLDITTIAPKDVFEFVLDNFVELTDTEQIQVTTLDDLRKEATTDDKTATATGPTDDKTTAVAPRESKTDSLTIKDKMTLLNLKSKTICLYSKKGGTGKTTIASELAHLYGKVVLPPKLGYDSKYLKTCLLDLDFEQGNVRGKLGIENPIPNNYIWIEDILSRIEKKEDVDSIAYSNAQVMSQFTKKVNGEFYVAINDQGGIPYRIVDKINAQDVDGKLFSKIIAIMITSLKKAFDVVIIDLPSEFKEECLVATKLSDLLLYVSNPTIMDMENFKVFLDEVKEYDALSFDKIAFVSNKEVKSGRIMELFDMIHKEICYTTFSYDLNKSVQLNVPIVSHVPFTTDCLIAESTYSFVTDKEMSLFKKELLKLAEFILPIFKVKTNRDAKKFNESQRVADSQVLHNVGLNEASAKKKAHEDELERKHQEQIRLKELKKQRRKKGKRAHTEPVSPKLEKDKKESDTINSVDKVDEKNKNFVNIESTKPIATSNVSKGKKKGLFSLFKKEPRKEETLDEFVARLVELSKNPKNRVKLDKFGFPHCVVKPKKVSNALWKKYKDELDKVNKRILEDQKSSK